MARGKNIFVLGLDEFNLALLHTIRDADSYRFVRLLDYGEVAQAEHFSVPALLAKAQAELAAFPDTVDAVVGYWDFPCSLMLPVLRRRLGLPGPSLEAVLRCEHKYWSRCLQAEVLPECVPRFRAVDPFDQRALEALDLPYPFWLKPVKSHSSHLGFKVHDAQELAACADVICANIARFAEPFNHSLSLAAPPPTRCARSTAITASPKS